MRKFAVVFSCALFLAACVAPLFAESKSVTGKLVDLACYKADHQDTGNQHVGRGWNCGRSCALEGFPVGVVTSDGKIYQITGDLASHANAKLQPHIGHTVTVTGDVTEKDGLTLISSSDLKMVSM